MKVLVTGAEGLVGKAIVIEIIKNKFQIVQLANIKSEPNKSGGDASIYRADISNLQSFAAALENVEADVFIHSAGLAHQFGKRSREDFWKVNVLGTENAAKIAVSLKARHFILISSVSVYGAGQAEGDDRIIKAKGIAEDAECNPQGAYAQSKYESEKIARGICRENGVALTILRLATVIGEEDKGNVARLIKAIDKKRFVWIGRGDNLKSLIYKGDAAKACLKVIGRTSGTEVFNVTSEAVKMKTIVAEISKRLGKKPPKLTIPPGLLEKVFALNQKIFKIRRLDDLAATLHKWLSDDVYSGEKFKTVYGFQPETSIVEAIKRQVEFYRKLK